MINIPQTSHTYEEDLSPAELNSADFRIRIPLYHPDMPFVLLWSEKAGCTIAVKWFFWQLGLLDTALAHHGWVHNYENEVFKKKPNYIEDCLDAISAGKDVVKIVRDPFARAFSGYLELCSPKVRSKGHWSRKQRMKVLKALTGTFVEIDYGFSYRQYVNWLTQQPVNTLNPHVREQYTAIEEKIDVVPFRLEDENPFHALERKYSLNSSSNEEGLFESAHHHHKTNLDPFPSLDFVDLAVPLSRSRSFSIVECPRAEIARSDIGQKIGRYFAKDFINYGYSLS